MLAVFLYFVNFIRTLLILVVVFLLIRWIAKLLTPNNTKKDTDNTKNNQGETTVHFNKKGEKLIDKDKGEYVDFEEVDKPE
jgi:flagellar biosynthesis/type III secretory pathway M-ring protein FliF/YscJ